MNREVHVRFCERFGGVTPPYLLDKNFLIQGGMALYFDQTFEHILSLN